MMAKVSKKAYTILMTSRKKDVGVSSGKTMVQKRRQGRAPSIAAASISDLGMLCKPARKNRKLYEICFQTAASTTRVIACCPSSKGFHSRPTARNQNETMPMLGASMNSHNTPATAGATA